MTRRERAADDCAAFSPSEADGGGFRWATARNGLAGWRSLRASTSICFLLSGGARPCGFHLKPVDQQLPQRLIGFYEVADLFHCSKLVNEMKRR